MELKYIKETKCPICGCDLIIEESIEADGTNKYREHNSGGRWEKRKFACGQQLEYSPNFQRTEKSLSFMCTNNIEYKLEMQKQEKALQNVKKYIDTLDTDTDYKDRLKRYMY